VLSGGSRPSSEGDTVDADGVSALQRTPSDAVAASHLEASGEQVDMTYEPWRDLISDIRTLRLDSCIAERLPSWPTP
jgi:hypothetical protein